MKMVWVIIFLWAILLCLPMFFEVRTTFPRLDSDYESNLPIYEYMTTFIKTHHSFPVVIPVVNSGISVLGDPLNTFLNPLFSLPILTFGINIGIRVSILLSCILSGITMFFLLQSLKVKKLVTLWGSGLYMSGGAFFAAVASGHIEKFLIYPFVPLLLAFSLREKQSLRNSIFLGCVFAMSVYSGDFYASWFFFLIFLTIRGYYFFTSPSKLKQMYYLLVSLLFFLIIASLKLVPFYFSVLPIMRRFDKIDSYKGSLQIFLFPVPFIMPFGVWFWDRPFFQRNFGFFYNWYEYFAFLTPLPFLFLLKIKKLLAQDTTKALLIVLLVGSLYFSLSFPDSPFFWIFHITPLSSLFRVPQRIVLPMTAVIVALLTLCLGVWMKGKTLPKITAFLLVATLLWTAGVDWGILKMTFVPIPKEKAEFARKVIQLDTSHEPVLNLSGASQTLLTRAGIPMLNFYYGWKNKNVPQFLLSGDVVNVPAIKKVQSQFILTPKKNRFEALGYALLYEDDVNAIWQKR